MIFGLVGVTIEGNTAIYEIDSGIYSNQALCETVGSKVFDIAKEYESKISTIKIKVIDDCVDSYGNKKKYTSTIEVNELTEVRKYADSFSFCRSSFWVANFGINYKPCNKNAKSPFESGGKAPATSNRGSLTFSPALFQFFAE